MKPSATSPTSPSTSSISSAELSKANPWSIPKPPSPASAATPHGHVAAVLGSLKKLDLHTLIARPASRMRDLVVAMIVARVIDARSKLATARALNPESAVSTLGQLLDLGAVNENKLYLAMDWLVRRQWGIEQRLAKRHLSDNTLMLYDLTLNKGDYIPK